MKPKTTESTSLSISERYFFRKQELSTSRNEDIKMEACQCQSTQDDLIERLLREMGYAYTYQYYLINGTL